jgi:tRNA (cmo5U34)-methyltransferase
MAKKQDELTVGDNITALNAGWKFSGKTVDSFDSHALKSIPLYREGHELIVKLSDYFLSDKSACYEIGCSTGELIHKLAIHNRQKDVDIFGIDIVGDMVNAARKKCSGDKGITVINDDILNLDLKKSDLIIFYYTLQFIKPKVRQLVVDKIYEALNWGGALILFEKVRANDARFQDIASTLYVDFKLDNGFTPEEIIGKTRSLKGVLEPFSSLGNQQLLQRAGFVDILPIMKYICFEGVLAIK